MIAKAYFAVAAQQVTTHQINLIKLEVTLNSNATAGLFLQIHDSNVAAAEGAAPVKSWPAGECAYKEFERGELTLGVGCYICLSTTAATKTLAAGGSDLMDVLQVEEFYPEYPTGTSYAGDLTTGVTSLQVWASASGPKKLVALEIDATGLSAAAFIMIFAKDSPTLGDKPVMQFPLADNAVITGANALKFGNDGIAIKSTDDTTVSKGCTVAISSTTGTLTLIAAQTVTIKAEYK